MTATPTTRRQFLQRVGYTATAAALIDAGSMFARPQQAMAKPPGSLSDFGRMFPDLPPLMLDPDPVTAVNQLAALAQSMEATAVPNPNNPGKKGAVYTYMGQFIDHDLSRNLANLPFDPVNGVPFSFIDPTTETDVETFRFDLSSVYNTSPPQGTGAVFDADGLHFLTQEPNKYGVPDLPRDENEVALIGDPRNDENELIAQVHHAFLRFHNNVVDALGITDLQTARNVVSQYYQWAVLTDFLPTIVGPDVTNGILNGSIPNPYPTGHVNTPFNPCEWADAAYRLHCMMRTAYALAVVDNGGHTLFGRTPAHPDPIDPFSNNLHGGRAIPGAAQTGAGTNQLQFEAFIDEISPITPVRQQFNGFRAQLGAPTFDLPIGGQTGVHATASAILAFRNLIRGYSHKLPSLQSVQDALGQPVIDPTVAINPSTVLGFEHGTPLWFGLLKEAEDPTLPGNAAAHVGPCAGRIIAGAYVQIMKDDKNGILHGQNKSFQPVPPIAPQAGKFTIADLFVFSGVASRPS